MCVYIWFSLSEFWCIFHFFKQRIGGEIKSISADEWVSPKILRRADKFMTYMLIAGKKALTDGGITEEVNREVDKSRCGVIIGSALGGLRVCLDTYMNSTSPNDFKLGIFFL